MRVQGFAPWRPVPETGFAGWLRQPIKFDGDDLVDCTPRNRCRGRWQRKHGSFKFAPQVPAQGAQPQPTLRTGGPGGITYVITAQGVPP